MSKKQSANSKRYDLEDRTTKFGKRVARLCKNLPQNPINNRLVPQAVSSAGSIGANYREANDALGKKDFVYRMRIARKESKECMRWLEMLKEANTKSGKIQEELDILIREAEELRNILSSIIQKV